MGGRDGRNIRRSPALCSRSLPLRRTEQHLIPPCRCHCSSCLLLFSSAELHHSYAGFSQFFPVDEVGMMEGTRWKMRGRWKLFFSKEWASMLGGENPSFSHLLSIPVLLLGCSQTGMGTRRRRRLLFRRLAADVR